MAKNWLVSPILFLFQGQIPAEASLALGAPRNGSLFRTIVSAFPDFVGTPP
jgi:hypothetical protein